MPPQVPAQLCGRLAHLAAEMGPQALLGRRQRQCAKQAAAFAPDWCRDAGQPGNPITNKRSKALAPDLLVQVTASATECA